MPHRHPILAMLTAYAEGHPEELPMVTRVRELVTAHPRCFERDCFPGHVTASAWIVSHDHRSFLLTHHRKLDRWLQLGGHADGDPDPVSVALREAREESGLSNFRVVPAAGGLLPVDVDVHRIPARKTEPEHWHHDLRFLLVAPPNEPLAISDESNDLRWFRREDLATVTDEESILRMAAKAWARLDLMRP